MNMEYLHHLGCWQQELHSDRGGHVPVPHYRYRYRYRYCCWCFPPLSSDHPLHYRIVDDAADMCVLYCIVLYCIVFWVRVGINRIQMRWSVYARRSTLDARRCFNFFNKKLYLAFLQPTLNERSHG